MWIVDKSDGLCPSQVCRKATEAIKDGGLKDETAMKELFKGCLSTKVEVWHFAAAAAHPCLPLPRAFGLAAASTRFLVSFLSRGAVFTSVLFTPEHAVCCIWRRAACCSQRRKHVGHWGIFATQTTSVGEVSGDAHLAVVRGSRRVFFDMKCSVKFNISCSSGGALGLPPESSALSESLGSYESKGKTTTLSSSTVVATASFAVCIETAVRQDRRVHSRTALVADGCRSCCAALDH